MDVGMDMVKRIVEVMDMDDRYDDNSGSSDDVGEVNKTSLNPRGGNPLGVLVQPSNGSHLGFQKNTTVFIVFFLFKRMTEIFILILMMMCIMRRPGPTVRWLS